MEGNKCAAVFFLYDAITIWILLIQAMAQFWRLFMNSLTRFHSNQTVSDHCFQKVLQKLQYCRLIQSAYAPSLIHIFPFSELYARFSFFKTTICHPIKTPDCFTRFLSDHRWWSNGLSSARWPGFRQVLSRSCPVQVVVTYFVLRRHLKYGISSWNFEYAKASDAVCHEICSWLWSMASSVLF